MPKKSGITGEEREMIAERYKEGDSVITIAKAMRLSLKTIYRVLQGQGVICDGRAPSNGNEPQEKIFTRLQGCINCLKAFNQYKGQEDKTICSENCYRIFAARIFPAKDPIKYPSLSCPPDTQEFKAYYMAKNAQFFKHITLKTEDNFDDLI